MSGRHFKTAAALLLAGSMAFTGCGNTIKTDQILVTMDGQTKTVGVANFMCQYNAVTYDSYYISYFGEDMWDSDIYSTGTTMADDLKEDVMEELQELYLLQAHMSEKGVEITSEEQNAIKAAAEAFLNSNSKKAIKYMGATQEIVEEYLTLLTIRDKMETAIKADVDKEVSDEESHQKKISYVLVPKGYNPEPEEGEEGENADTSADVSEDAESEETEKEDKSKEYAFLIAMMAEEKSLEEICEEYEGFSVQSATYSQTDLDPAKNTTSLDVEVLKAAEELQAGQVTDEFVTTDEGSYVIRLDSEYDEDATNRKIESIIEERESDLYDEVLQGYKDACDWKVDEAVLAKINFKNFYKLVTDKVSDSEAEESGETEAETDEDGVVTVGDESAQ